MMAETIIASVFVVAEGWMAGVYPVYFYHAL
jgi:hypothetical protein